MIASLCAAAACYIGLYALFGLRSPAAERGASLIRATTLSPLEWREQQRSREGWYRHWLRPVALLWGHRLHLRPVRLDAQYLTQAGVDPAMVDGLELRVACLACALGGLLLAGLLSVAVPPAIFMLPLLGWIGYVTPARYLHRRRRRRQEEVQRELPELVSMLRAFVVAGVPLERSLHLLSAGHDGGGVLHREVRLALARYGLGASIEEALHEIGPRTGTDDIGLFISALGQCKRVGSGLEQTLRDQEVLMRMNQRNRSTAEAARVSTKLLGVLAAIYLPEFVILIMVPLFWGIIQRAFG